MTSDRAEVFGGVDTHKDAHVAAAVDAAGRCLGTAEFAELDCELRRLCQQANPALLGACGVGAEVASSLLITAGDNPTRMRSEASFAALCGTSPIEASSGQAKRHRLLTDPPPVPRGPDLRQQRTRKGLTITTIATALNTPPTRISELERDLRHNHDLAQRYQQHL